MTTDYVVKADQIERIFRFGPFQEGFLFHALLAPDAAAYVTQLSLRFDDPVDTPVSKDASCCVVHQDRVRRVLPLGRPGGTSAGGASGIALPLEGRNSRRIPAGERAERRDLLLRADQASPSIQPGTPCCVSISVGWMMPPIGSSSLASSIPPGTTRTFPVPGSANQNLIGS